MGNRIAYTRLNLANELIENQIKLKGYEKVKSIPDKYNTAANKDKKFVIYQKYSKIHNFYSHKLSSYTKGNQFAFKNMIVIVNPTNYRLNNILTTKYDEIHYCEGVVDTNDEFIEVTAISDKLDGITQYTGEISCDQPHGAGLLKSYKCVKGDDFVKKTYEVYDGKFSWGYKYDLGYLYKKEVNWHNGKFKHIDLTQGYSAIIETTYNGTFEHDKFHGKGMLVTNTRKDFPVEKHNITHLEGLFEYGNYVNK